MSKKVGHSKGQDPGKLEDYKKDHDKGQPEGYEVWPVCELRYQTIRGVRVLCP